MRQLGEDLAEKGFTLRSGHSSGPDIAFQEGHSLVNKNMEIYLPYVGFNAAPIKNIPSYYIVPDFVNKLDYMQIAQKHHPAWGACAAADRKLLARNVCQVIGEDLCTASDFLICWTKDGAAVGGTGQTMRIARAYCVPIYNLFYDADLHRLIDHVRTGARKE